MPNKVIIEVIKKSGAAETLTFDAPAELTVGRSSSCGYCLDCDALASRTHAILMIDPPVVRLKDLRSTNGVSINGKIFGGTKNPRQSLLEPTELADGDEVKIGETLFRLKKRDEADDCTVCEPDARIGVQGRSRGREPNPEFSASRRRMPEVEGYELLKVLGTGSMGTVYLAEKRDVGIQVALKVLTVGGNLSDKILDVFWREVDMSRSVTHPNIVALLGSGISRERLLYIALEYVNGGDLDGLLSTYPGRRLPLFEAYFCMLQIAEGMQCVHDHGIVHRDIKPHNILLNRAGGTLTAKVADLGLAKSFESSGLSGVTSSFAGGGTMAYMPPEQLTDFRDVRPSSDVFSVAATFYEMLTGQLAYNFTAKGDRIQTIVSGDIIPITERAPNLPPQLTAIIDKSLAVNPGHRFQHCAEMLKALQELEGIIKQFC